MEKHDNLNRLASLDLSHNKLSLLKSASIFELRKGSPMINVKYTKLIEKPKKSKSKKKQSKQ